MVWQLQQFYEYTNSEWNTVDLRQTSREKLNLNTDLMSHFMQKNMS